MVAVPSRSRAALVAVALTLVVALAHGDTSRLVVRHPDDPAFLGGAQWNLAAIGAPRAWAHGTGTGSVIAVIDSGVDRRHLDLRGRVLDGTDCLGTGGDPSRCHGGGTDVDGHGSH